MKKNPMLYLDTNVCRDVMKERGTESTLLIEKIRDKKLDCFISIFTLMEITDVQQDDIFVSKMVRHGWEYNKICRGKYQKELSQDELSEPIEKINNFFIHYKFLKLVTLNPDGWKLAFNISSKTTVSSPDSIHLATAWQSGCNLLVTNDQDFIKNGNNILKTEKASTMMKICTSKDASNTIKGFKLK